MFRKKVSFVTLKNVEFLSPVCYNAPATKYYVFRAG